MNRLLSTSALIVTLAFANAAYARDAKGPDAEPSFIEEALSQLPEKDASLFRDTMKKSHEKDKALHDQMHKLHDELHEIAIADEFDKEAFIEKSNELAKLQAKMHASMTEAFANALEKLPADERKTVADAVHDHDRHGKKAGADASDGDK